MIWIMNFLSLLWSGPKAFLKYAFNHRRFQLWAMWAAGAMFLLYSIAPVAFLFLYPWPALLLPELLGHVAVIVYLLLGLCGVAMFLMSDMVKSVKVKAGQAVEIELETKGDDE